jgi:hypothetical protein
MAKRGRPESGGERGAVRIRTSDGAVRVAEGFVRQHNVTAMRDLVRQTILHREGEFAWILKWARLAMLVWTRWVGGPSVADMTDDLDLKGSARDVATFCSERPITQWTGGDEQGVQALMTALVRQAFEDGEDFDHGPPVRRLLIWKPHNWRSLMVSAIVERDPIRHAHEALSLALFVGGTPMARDVLVRRNRIDLLEAWMCDPRATNVVRSYPHHTAIVEALSGGVDASCARAVLVRDDVREHIASRWLLHERLEIISIFERLVAEGFADAHESYAAIASDYCSMGGELTSQMKRLRRASSTITETAEPPLPAPPSPPQVAVGAQLPPIEPGDVDRNVAVALWDDKFVAPSFLADRRTPAPPVHTRVVGIHLHVCSLQGKRYTARQVVEHLRRYLEGLPLEGTVFMGEPAGVQGRLEHFDVLDTMFVRSTLSVVLRMSTARDAKLLAHQLAAPHARRALTDEIAFLAAKARRVRKLPFMKVGCEYGFTNPSPKPVVTSMMLARIDVVPVSAIESRANARDALRKYLDDRGINPTNLVQVGGVMYFSNCEQIILRFGTSPTDGGNQLVPLRHYRVNRVRVATLLLRVDYMPPLVADASFGETGVRKAVATKYKYLLDQPMLIVNPYEVDDNGSLLWPRVDWMGSRWNGVNVRIVAPIRSREAGLIDAHGTTCATLVQSLATQNLKQPPPVAIPQQVAADLVRRASGDPIAPVVDNFNLQFERIQVVPMRSFAPASDIPLRNAVYNLLETPFIERDPNVPRLPLVQPAATLGLSLRESLRLTRNGRPAPLASMPVVHKGGVYLDQLNVHIDEFRAHAAACLREAGGTMQQVDMERDARMVAYLRDHTPTMERDGGVSVGPLIRIKLVAKATPALPLAIFLGSVLIPFFRDYAWDMSLADSKRVTEARLAYERRLRTIIDNAPDAPFPTQTLQRLLNLPPLNLVIEASASESVWSPIMNAFVMPLNHLNACFRKLRTMSDDAIACAGGTSRLLIAKAREFTETAEVLQAERSRLAKGEIADVDTRLRHLLMNEYEALRDAPPAVGGSPVTVPVTPGEATREAIKRNLIGPSDPLHEVRAEEFHLHSVATIVTASQRGMQPRTLFDALPDLRQIITVGVGSVGRSEMVRQQSRHLEYSVHFRSLPAWPRRVLGFSTVDHTHVQARHRRLANVTNPGPLLALVLSALGRLKEIETLSSAIAELRSPTLPLKRRMHDQPRYAAALHETGSSVPDPFAFALKFFEWYRDDFVDRFERRGMNVVARACLAAYAVRQSRGMPVPEHWRKSIQLSGPQVDMFGADCRLTPAETWGALHNARDDLSVALFKMDGTHDGNTGIMRWNGVEYEFIGYEPLQDSMSPRPTVVAFYGPSHPTSKWDNAGAYSYYQQRGARFELAKIGKFNDVLGSDGQWHAPEELRRLYRWKFRGGWAINTYKVGNQDVRNYYLPGLASRERAWLLRDFERVSLEPAALAEVRDRYRWMRLGYAHKLITHWKSWKLGMCRGMFGAPGALDAIGAYRAKLTRDAMRLTTRFECAHNEEWALIVDWGDSETRPPLSPDHPPADRPWVRAHLTTGELDHHCGFRRTIGTFIGASPGAHISADASEGPALDLRMHLTRYERSCAPISPIPEAECAGFIVI